MANYTSLLYEMDHKTFSMCTQHMKKKKKKKDHWLSRRSVRVKFAWIVLLPFIDKS